MPLEKIIKASPAFWIAGTAAVIIGAAFTVDARYAKAADVSQAKQELKADLEKHRGYTEAGFLKQRKAQLEDKLFELEAKREAHKINEVELKLLFRYRSEFDDVNRELRVKSR